MRLRSKLLTSAFLVVAAIVPAQQVREQPPAYSGPFTLIPGVFVTPIPGAPFSATVMIQSKQPLADGTVETEVTESVIARDSRGRIRNERHMLVPEGTKGMPRLVSVHVFDPATRISYIYNPATMIARQQLVPLPVARPEFGNSKSEDLGYTTLNGFEAKGTRTTRIVPAPASGTRNPVTVTDEVWYSEDLHMNLMEEHTDVRGGKQTVAILSIQRNEPATSLFEVPAGYKIVDMTPPRNAPVTGGGSGH